MFFAKYSNLARYASYISLAIALFFLYRNSDITFQNWSLKVDLYLPSIPLLIVVLCLLDSFFTSRLSKWAKTKHLKSLVFQMLGNQKPSENTN